MVVSMPGSGSDVDMASQQYKSSVSSPSVSFTSMPNEVIQEVFDQVASFATFEPEPYEAKTQAEVSIDEVSDNQEELGLGLNNFCALMNLKYFRLPWMKLLVHQPHDESPSKRLRWELVPNSLETLYFTSELFL